MLVTIDLQSRYSRTFSDFICIYGYDLKVLDLECTLPETQKPQNQDPN